MSSDTLRELEQLVGQAVAEVAALRKENGSLEKRLDTLKRDLKSRTEALRATEGDSESWGLERSQLRDRVAKLVRRLEDLETG